MMYTNIFINIFLSVFSFTLSKINKPEVNGTTVFRVLMNGRRLAYCQYISEHVKGRTVKQRLHRRR